MPETAARLWPWRRNRVCVARTRSGLRPMAMRGEPWPRLALGRGTIWSGFIGPVSLCGAARRESASGALSWASSQSHRMSPLSLTSLLRLLLHPCCWFFRLFAKLIVAIHYKAASSLAAATGQVKLSLHLPPPSFWPWSRGYSPLCLLVKQSLETPSTTPLLSLQATARFSHCSLRMTFPKHSFLTPTLPKVWPRTKDDFKLPPLTPPLPPLRNGHLRKSRRWKIRRPRLQSRQLRSALPQEV